MLIFVFILVPYLTIMNRIAVKVPETQTKVVLKGNEAQPLEIPVFVLKERNGYQIRLGTKENKAVDIHSVVDQVVKDYREKAKASKSVDLLFRADRALSYQNVMEILSELGTLEERFLKPVEYQLLYVHESE